MWALFRSPINEIGTTHRHRASTQSRAGPTQPSKTLASARPAARPREAAARQPQKRQTRGARRDAGRNDPDDDGDDYGDDGDPDQLVPDPVICREFGISAMTLWRWDHDPTLNFPKRISIRNRNFRSRKQIEAFKRRLVRGAIAQRVIAPHG